MVLSVFPKNYEIRKEEGITVLIEVTVKYGYIMVGDDSGEPFVFVVSVIGSKNIPTTEKNLAVTDLQSILTPLFVTVDIFALVVPYLFSV